MISTILAVMLFGIGQTENLGPGNHVRNLTIGKSKRMYVIHIPPQYDASQPTPVVLALHGLGMSGRMMEAFSGLSKKADEVGFIAVYPNGTGLISSWNAGAFAGDQDKDRANDVSFLCNVLDDVEAKMNVDRKRIYVTGMSNGAMMAYRLACESPERIAAIAPVAGTMAESCSPKSPVPVLHFHGTQDTLVPYLGPTKDMKKIVRCCSVDDTMKLWAKTNGCEGDPKKTELPTSTDKLQVICREFCGGIADITFYEIRGGGHTWPGMSFHAHWLGETTLNINANDLMWDFFVKHPRK